MGLADIVVEKQEPSALVLPQNKEGEVFKNLLKNLEKLSSDAKTELLGQGYKAEQIEIKRYLNLLYQGTDTALMTSEPDEVLNYDTGNTNCELGVSESSSELQKNSAKFPDYVGAFKQTYLREFGFDLTGREIIVDDLRVRAVAKSPGLQKYPLAKKAGTPEAVDQTKCYFMSESSGC